MKFKPLLLNPLPVAFDKDYYLSAINGLRTMI